MEFPPKPFFSLVHPPAQNMGAMLGKNMLEIWYEAADLPVSEPAIYRLMAEDTAPPEKS